MSKTYQVEFSQRASKALSKIDPPNKQLIVSWIEERLEGCSDPRRYGKSLTGEFSGAWRYRVGSYRIVADIIDDKILIHVLDVGHRRKIYKR
ncbi:MAG: type II toxin-antitoxin system RelE/ParE family toxin [Coriobacteriia bacterium]|nr:type II toxin-antitoxin system RelE/ParE family toxin [Coriobacteriia bacterium]